MSDETRSADGAAYERIVERYVPTCPVLIGADADERCTWVGRRADHESDAYSEIAGHIRRDHPGYVTKRRYRHMILWEPYSGPDVAEKE